MSFKAENPEKQQVLLIFLHKTCKFRKIGVILQPLTKSIDR